MTRNSIPIPINGIMMIKEVETKNYY